MKNEEVVRLFDQYAGDIYRLALSYLGSKQEAEDVVQEVYLKLLSKVLTLKPDYEKAYLMKMTVNRCKNLLKSSAYKDNVALEDAALTRFCELTDEERELCDVLMRMDAKTRVPLYLYYYEGYQYKEIARILKISESAVAMRIKRGKEQLKEKLE